MYKILYKQIDKNYIEQLYKILAQKHIKWDGMRQDGMGDITGWDMLGRTGWIGWVGQDRI